MSHPAQQAYFRSVKDRLPVHFENKAVMDCGSLDVNGNLRDLFTGGQYVGVDVVDGPNVDLVCLVHKLPFTDLFDTVVSGEMLEHSEHWRQDLKTMYRMTKPGGLLVLSCAGPGRPEHGTPRSGDPAWGPNPDYYRNLSTTDIRSILPEDLFVWSECLRRDTDTYFAGVKIVPEYHSQLAFERRLACRQAAPVVPDPVAVFYHVACMPGWEAIVAEQMAVFKHTGVEHLRAYILAPDPADAKRCGRIAAHYKVKLHVLGTSPDLGLHEAPTITAVYDWARSNPHGAVVYTHTKGVSAPDDEHKRKWRRVMARYVLADWNDNLTRLQYADLVGCAWQPNHDYPHFCGNFWAARCDWLARLPDPKTYPTSRPDFSWAGVHSWRQRMWCETWIGGQPYHHVDDRIGIGFRMWTDDLWKLDEHIDGFDYAKKLVVPR